MGFGRVGSELEGSMEWVKVLVWPNDLLIPGMIR